MADKVYYTMLGDSISLGYTKFVEKYLPDNFEMVKKSGDKEAFINLDLPKGSNCGDSGRMLSYIKDYYESGVLDKDFYTVNCGLHDIKTNPETGERQIELEDYEKNLRAIFEIFNKAGKKMFWVRTTDVNEAVHNEKQRKFHRFHKDVVAYNEVADKLCKEYGIEEIDLYEFSRSFGDDVYRDHVHFPEEVEDKQAEFICKTIMLKL